MRETIRVSAQEAMELSKFQRIQAKLKNKEILTDDELLFVLPQEEATRLKSAKLREDGLNKENTEYQRKVNLRRNECQLRQLEREKTYKQAQINTQTMLETDERFIDKQKPAFYLNNEIDLIDVKIAEVQEQNENLRKEMK